MTATRIEIVVLGLLSEEPMHGYEILERMRERSMGFWLEVGRASIYQALPRLERRGLIAGREHESRTAPDRRTYRITRAGRDVLAAGMDERFGRIAPFETDAGEALGFLHVLGAAKARVALEARSRAVQDLLDAVRDERARATAERGAPRTVANAMLDRQEALAKAELAWLRSARASLTRLKR